MLYMLLTWLAEGQAAAPFRSAFVDTLGKLVIAYAAMVIIRFGDDLFHLCTGP